MGYDSTIWEKLNSYKDEIVNSCEVCGGHGYIDDDTTCNCMKVFKYISKLFVAGIPSEYWQLHYTELAIDADIKKLIEKYFIYFSNAVKKHKGMMFVGTNGVGKTALMCEIGKFAISENYKIKFFSFEDMINAYFKRDENFFNSLNQADIHLLDEFGKGYVKDGSLFVPVKIEQYIKRTIADKVLILTTNFNESDLSELLGDSITSALERQIVTVNIDGKDYSSKRQADWAEDLKTGYDYYHKNIMIYANKFN